MARVFALNLTMTTRVAAYQFLRFLKSDKKSIDQREPKHAETAQP
jgi:hypothetical protein